MQMLIFKMLIAWWVTAFKLASSPSLFGNIIWSFFSEQEEPGIHFQKDEQQSLKQSNMK